MIFQKRVGVNFMTIDSTFWVAVSFFIFFGGLIYLKIPQKINEILNKLEGKRGLEFIEKGLDLIKVSSTTNGFENLPKNGGVVIVANHPLGGLDGVTLMKEIGKIRRDIKFIVNDILNQFEPFNSLFMPVNKHGSNTRDSIMRIDELYQSDQCIVIFPAGLVSRKQKEKVEDLDWWNNTNSSR